MERLLPDAGSPVRENLLRIEETVAAACREAGRAREEVALLAVTKTVAPALINEAIRLGVTRIGENRVQEYLGKKDALLLKGVETHLIGHLQTNKVSKNCGTGGYDPVYRFPPRGAGGSPDFAEAGAGHPSVGGGQHRWGRGQIRRPADQAAELVAAMGEIEGIRVGD